MNQPPSLVSDSLSSQWDGLSPHLIASFYEVKKIKEGIWQRSNDTDPKSVFAPLTEASMEMSLNWQSPFEHAGPESRAPTLLAMLQSGALQPVIDAFLGNENPDRSAIGLAQQKSNEFVRQFEGRTGITKLNSTQVFNGMPPVKIQVTAIFRAWDDPTKEVEEPFNKLMEWALPVKLSPDGSVLARSAQAARGNSGFIDALVPSIAPTTIALRYKNRIYSPLVIEAISEQMTSSIDAKARYVELLVPMTLATLTALDRDDWVNYNALKL